jgi:hypothetical protein
MSDYKMDESIDSEERLKNSLMNGKGNQNIREDREITGVSTFFKMIFNPSCLIKRKKCARPKISC